MTVKKLYVVGSGAMGSGIAQTAATHGIQVIMNDINEEFVAKGYNKIKKSLEKAVTKGRMTEEAKEVALANLTTTVSLEDAKDADFVIEAASENKEIKLGIFKQLDKICKPEAILASNTSSLPITEIAAATGRPDQVIGTHFFNPVPAMKLLEIVMGLQTSETTYQAALALGEQLEKVPYIPILDLAICFYYAFDEAGVDNGMIPIYRSHLDNWKVTDRDLLEIAVKNTPRLFPGETIPMEDVLGDALQELPEEVRREFLRKVSMMILTNSRKTYGACSILYPGMLEQLAERIGGDYYMIPSSVHEFLLVPREREQDREELKKMIAEVNRTELPPEEVLSDHLYLYCSREREVRIV